MKEALIVVDMLCDFLEEGGALYCGNRARRIIPFVKRTIERFRKNKHVVIYATDSHSRNDAQFRLFGRHCVSGSYGSRIIEEIKPDRGDFVVPKSTYDATFKSDLVKILKRHRVKKVFLVGVCTSICVMETASSLTKLGFGVNILKRGVADFDKSAHNFALKRMKLIYGAKII